jgi:hypothetical protein
MRKSFDGLAEHVRGFLGHDPLCGSMFVFRNKNAQRAKILWWDKDGLAVSATQNPRDADLSGVVCMASTLRPRSGGRLLSPA